MSRSIIPLSCHVERSQGEPESGEKNPLPARASPNSQTCACSPNPNSACSQVTCANPLSGLRVLKIGREMAQSGLPLAEVWKVEPHCDHCEIWNAERSAECRSQAFPPFSFLLELKRSNRACPRQTESILAVACAWFRQWKKITPPSENLQPTQHPSRTKTVGPMEKEKMRHRPTPQLHMYAHRQQLA